MSGLSSKSSPLLSVAAASNTPASRSFASVHDVIGETPAPGLATAAKLSLDALKDILEAVDTLPCVKYIAGVGVKILNLTDEVQSNKDAVRGISIRAGDVVLAVARACEGAQEDMAAPLESDLQQLTGTMNNILSFTSDMASRPGYKRLLYKMEDANAIKALDTQLTHAFQVFEIQSNVSLRISQQQLAQRLTNAPSAARSELVTTAPLRVPEGLYIIRSGVDGRVFEVEHSRLRTRKRNAHVYVAPFQQTISLYQLWWVFKREGKELEYTIRSYATGATLDVFCSQEQPGTQVIGHSAYGRPNQHWAFYATRSAAGYDYCTIRSYGPPTVMDAKCANGSDCDLLHMSRLRADGPYISQEWSLTRLPTTPTVARPRPVPNAPHPAPENIPRRQNVRKSGSPGRPPSGGLGHPCRPRVPAVALGHTVTLR
ncbi:RICIN domain-containing protein [Phanerochaete sordida]|uniref:RICIN domain-containing protein n=1 Tax=Phanerochaete sordida TaxID=48140 RepID=A0A9P3GII7_9APHY|nr:RICIN domain-containing protein [Phanerochaete sordida]